MDGWRKLFHCTIWLFLVSQQATDTAEPLENLAMPVIPNRANAAFKCRAAMGRLRGGSPATEKAGSRADRSPAVFDVVSSPFLRQLAQTCASEPTAKDVYELAKNLTPEDKAVLRGPQNMSLFGHCATVNRIRRQKLAIDDDEKEVENITNKLLKLRSRLKKWKVSSLYSDELFEVMKNSNMTMRELGQQKVPPGGWPMYRPHQVAVRPHKSAASALLQRLHIRFASALAAAQGVAARFRHPSRGPRGSIRFASSCADARGGAPGAHRATPTCADGLRHVQVCLCVCVCVRRGEDIFSFLLMSIFYCTVMNFSSFCACVCYSTFAGA